MPKKLTKREIDYLIGLVTVEMSMVGFLKGFAKLSKDEAKKKIELSKIIIKLQDYIMPKISRYVSIRYQDRPYDFNNCEGII